MSIETWPLILHVIELGSNIHQYSLSLLNWTSKDLLIWLCDHRLLISVCIHVRCSALFSWSFIRFKIFFESENPSLNLFFLSGSLKSMHGKHYKFLLVEENMSHSLLICAPLTCLQKNHEMGNYHLVIFILYCWGWKNPRSNVDILLVILKTKYSALLL